MDSTINQLLEEVRVRDLRDQLDRAGITTEGLKGLDRFTGVGDEEFDQLFILLRYRQSEIIGEDSRLNPLLPAERLAQLLPPSQADDLLAEFEEIRDAVRRVARSVALITVEDRLTAPGVGLLGHRLITQPLQLHGDERFAGEPTVGGGSSTPATGFLIGPDLLATARHCVPEGEDQLQRLRFVFGYGIRSDETPQLSFSVNQVYRAHPDRPPVRIHSPNGWRDDWAVVVLDRPVEGREPLRRQQAVVEMDQSLYALGHPFGLPLKFVGEGKVLVVENGLVKVDLDLSNGNSGSPVLDARTHEVVGIATNAGGRDRIPVNGSFRWNPCSRNANASEGPNPNGCRRQDVVPITSLPPQLGMVD